MINLDAAANNLEALLRERISACGIESREEYLRSRDVVIGAIYTALEEHEAELRDKEERATLLFHKLEQALFDPGLPSDGNRTNLRPEASDLSSSDSPEAIGVSNEDHYRDGSGGGGGGGGGKMVRLPIMLLSMQFPDCTF
jgi:hypothetical protein